MGKKEGAGDVIGWLLSQLWPALVGFLASAIFILRERTKRKQAERTIKDMKKRDEIREDVRIDTDEALVDRLSRR